MEEVFKSLYPVVKNLETLSSIVLEKTGCHMLEVYNTNCCFKTPGSTVLNLLKIVHPVVPTFNIFSRVPLLVKSCQNFPRGEL